MFDLILIFDFLNFLLSIFYGLTLYTTQGTRRKRKKREISRERDRVYREKRGERRRRGRGKGIHQERDGLYAILIIICISCTYTTHTEKAGKGERMRERVLRASVCSKIKIKSVLATLATSPPLSAQTLSLFIHVFIYLHLAMPAAACERRTGSRSLSVTETQGASRDFWKKPLAPFLSPVSSAASPA